jgi:tetratricopeptide (TPR) repeat protein
VKLLGLGLLVVLGAPAAPPPSRIQIDYPEDGAVFPPDFASPTFVWRDPDSGSARWQIEIVLPDGGPAMRRDSVGERMTVGVIDPRAVAESNRLPTLTPEQAAAHTWKPDAGDWAEIKRRAGGHSAVVRITGGESRGEVRISISKDPVGAPIFYRDVPLMPTEVEKGVIKPIIPSAVPLIAWRLRHVGDTESRLLMEGLPTCANCHSFSRDGKWLGMDVDGPQNDKGMYAIAPVGPRTTIRTSDVFTWNDFPGNAPGKRTIGFMAQISPDGRYAVATVNEDVFVANFKNYGFLQVFYPTTGILAWYERATGRMRSLPGADNPKFVQTNGVWTPDGKELIFSRAAAREPYPKGRAMPQYAGDPLETPIQYDLYRIPFNGGKGGRPKAIPGASHNGMSNSFPRVSPDGRWIVFVESRNGQLMRPDGQLYIVPAAGGEARRMRANTARMNSWHSFSPNSRWLVFSSKSRSLYTQMFLTHIDEEGNDSPAILIENATAANRAVNIPEFVNAAPGDLRELEVPAADFYRLFDTASNLADRGDFESSIAEWRKALALNPENAKAHNNFGRALAGKGDFEAAIAHWKRALELKPSYWEAHNNLGVALMGSGKTREAADHFRRILRANPGYPQVHANLARALAQQGKSDEAVAEWRKALELNPGFAEAYNDLAAELLRRGRSEEALAAWQQAVKANPRFGPAHFNLGNAWRARGKEREAAAEWRMAMELAVEQPDPRLADAARARLATIGGGR